MPRSVVLFSALALGVVAPRPAPADTIELHTTAVPLDAADPARTVVGRLRYRGGLRLTSPDRRFGGLSALHVDSDGVGLLAVTDQGHWLRARLTYDDSGMLSGVAQAELGALGDTLGQPLVGKVNQDAESLALLVDGSWIVGFERRHRLWRYPAGLTLQGAATPLPTPQELVKAPENGGVEALATLRDGRLVALCEELLVDHGVRGFVREGRRWRKFVYPVAGLARPSAAAGLPSGQLLVLERGYSPDAGLTVRLRRVLARHLRKNALVSGELVAEIQPPLTVDNFEGLATRRSVTGETLVYLLSDDNFSADQRTLLLLFALDEAGLRAHAAPPGLGEPRPSTADAGRRTQRTTANEGSRRATPTTQAEAASAGEFTSPQRAGGLGGAAQPPPAQQSHAGEFTSPQRAGGLGGAAPTTDAETASAGEFTSPQRAGGLGGAAQPPPAQQ